MGTQVTIMVRLEAGVSKAQAVIAVDKAFREIDRVEQLMSEWLPASEVSKINQQAGSAVSVSKETLTLLETSKQVGEWTDGAFDVTWAAMRGLWHFGNDTFEPPSTAARRTVRRLVDYEKLQLDKQSQTVRLAVPGMAIGVGGIAKGYGVERALSVLQASGLQHVVVSAGGDMAVRGRKLDRQWHVGIRHPRQPNNLLGTIAIADEAVVTSGDYERYREHDGVRYHHIIDPRTGMPARGTQSVTIVARDATIADALATGVFVLGPTAGLALIERLPNVEGLVVTATGEIKMTAGLQGRFWPKPSEPKTP